MRLQRPVAAAPGLPTSRRNRGLLLGVALAAGVCFSGSVAAALSANDLCTGDPCVITEDVVVTTSPVEIDFGSRSVFLRAVLDARDATLTLRAGRFAVEGPGQIRGSNTVVVESMGDLRLDSTSSRGAVRMVDEEGGDLRLLAAGTVAGVGRIILSSNDSEGDGGNLVIDAGTVSLTGLIEALGGLDGGGGSVEVVADGNVSLTGGIELDGGGFDGGSLDVAAGGSITLGSVVLDGNGDIGNGGDANLVATGNITLLDDMTTRGSGASADECGDGGSIDAHAGGVLTIAAPLDVSAREGDCWAGALDLRAATVLLQAPLLLRGPEHDGRGGELALTTTADFTCATVINFSGGALGGEVRMEGAANLTVAAGCVLDGDGPGAIVELTSGDQLDFDGVLDVGSTSPGIAHEPTQVRLAACSLNIGAGAELRSVGIGASHRFTVAGDVVLRGLVRTSAENALVVPVGSAPLVLGSVLPPLATTFDSALLPCGVEAPTATPVQTAPTPTATPSATQPAEATPTVSRSPDLPTWTPSPTSMPASPTATSPAATATASASPTVTPTAVDACAGDCDGNGSVAIGELVRLVGIALGSGADCAALRDGEVVGIPLLIRAVRSSLDGCSPPPPS